MLLGTTCHRPTSKQALEPAGLSVASGGDELTPTMNLQRRPIAAKYAAAIEALYQAH
jgi:long-subunit acyl-CoA synthetase (AMP-forming)